MCQFKKSFPAKQKARDSKSLHSDISRLSRDQRHQALGLVQGGVTYSEIAHRMGCSHTTRRLIVRHRGTSSVVDRPRPGHERVTTPSQDRHIGLRLLHLRDQFRTTAYLADNNVNVLQWPAFSPDFHPALMGSVRPSYSSSNT